MVEGDEHEYRPCAAQPIKPPRAYPPASTLRIWRRTENRGFMTGYIRDETPTAEDVSFLFRLALGRLPSTEELATAVNQPMSVCVPGLFRSRDFKALRSRVTRRLPLDGGDHAIPPDAALLRWAADFFPVPHPTREAVRRASDWPSLFEVLFSDWRFRKHIAREWRGLSLRAFLAGLRALQKPSASIIGAVDAWSDSSVRGWAADRHMPERSLIVEIWLGGRFIAAGRTRTGQEHPVGDRWSHAGATGFTISIPAGALAGTDCLAEVREESSGFVIGRFETRDFKAPPVDAIGEIRGQLHALRQMIDRIEGKLPDFQAALGFSLESYDAYFEAYYVPLREHAVAGVADAPMCVLVDATQASPAALARTLAALDRQTAEVAELMLLYRDGDAALEMLALVDSYRTKDGRRTLVSARSIGGSTLAPIANALVANTDQPDILWLPAGCALAPDAIEMFASALSAGAAIAFSDSDQLEGDPWSVRPRHVAPQFRAAFDGTRALQQDICGPVLAIQRRQLLDAQLRDGFGTASLYEFILRAAHSGTEPRHVPRILYHTEHRTEAEVADRLKAVEALLAEFHPAATVEPMRDVMEAPTQALRVRWPLSRKKIAIIVPTRDRVDLLMPCLGSIEASISHNQVDLELIVVDNQSQEPETERFLRKVASSAVGRVVQYDGSFNWAAMNNVAATQSDADIFVFLNNDTVILSPDCWDALSAQALRPEVGAVGARLLYADGTVQHAGVVMDEWHSFASHEGTGLAGNAGGYLDRNLVAREVSMVTGACLATRADVFRRIGGFDATAFPVEGNDTDYCLRVRSLGLKVLYEGQACLYHFESKSRGYNDDAHKQRRAFAATQLLKARWPTYATDPYYNPHFDRLAPPFTRLQAPRPFHIASQA
jgi:O-antigen biosynthesis protein